MKVRPESYQRDRTENNKLLLLLHCNHVLAIGDAKKIASLSLKSSDKLTVAHLLIKLVTKKKALVPENDIEEERRKSRKVVGALVKHSRHPIYLLLLLLLFSGKQRA